MAVTPYNTLATVPAGIANNVGHVTAAEVQSLENISKTSANMPLKGQSSVHQYIKADLKGSDGAKDIQTPAASKVTFTAAPLPYAYDALASKGMSKEQVIVHYDKHHKGYAQKLTDLVAKDASLQGLTLVDLLLTQPSGPVFNCAAQIWNHDFYWNCMSPNGGGVPPEGPLLEQIKKQWGTVEQFQSEFTKAAMGHFGSGWAWLVKTPMKNLAIVTTKDADIPALHGLHPVLVCDVWEHAYYIDHRNDRAKHLEAFWKLVNWEFAGANFVTAYL